MKFSIENLSCYIKQDRKKLQICSRYTKKIFSRKLSFLCSDKKLMETRCILQRFNSTHLRETV